MTKKSCILPAPRFFGETSERKENKNMKSIALMIGLLAMGAATAAANSLPPCPEAPAVVR